MLTLGLLQFQKCDLNNLLPQQTRDLNHHKILKGMNINVCIVNARFVKPLDKDLIIPLANKIKKVVTMEEGTLIGGFGSAIVELFNDSEVNIPVYRIGIPDVLVDHASPDQSKEKLGLLPDQMADKIIKRFKLNN